MPPSNMECFICCSHASHCVPKCQLHLLLHTNPLDFLCSPLCIFLIERCRMFWKLFYERSFLDLLLSCCPVAWSTQLETPLCFYVIILLIYACFYGCCWVWVGVGANLWLSLPSGSLGGRTEWNFFHISHFHSQFFSIENFLLISWCLGLFLPFLT